jgi:hypothetical protein
VVLFWSLGQFCRKGVTETLNHVQKLQALGMQFKALLDHPQNLIN